MTGRIFGIRLRRSTRERMMACLAMIGMLVGLVVAPAHADDGGLSGPRPGATDPLAGGGSVVRDDELFAAVPRSDGGFDRASYTPSSDLATLTPEESSEGAATSQVVAASGRFLSPDEDNVVMAYRDGSDLIIEVDGDANSRYIGASNVAPPVTRQRGSLTFQGTDFIDIAVGDLDRKVDAEQQYRDEVVVAYAAPGFAANTLMIVLIVYDFTAADVNGGAAIAARDTIPLDAFSDTSRPGIVPSDNILGVATGDFDGDGTHTVALAYLTNGETVRIAHFTYTTSDQGTMLVQDGSTISPEFQYDGFQNQGWIGSLDVATGDFNGDKKDELAVAAAAWGEDNFIAGTFIYKGDAQLRLRYAGVGHVSSGNSQNPLDPREPLPLLFPRIQIAAGLFKIDGAAGFGLGRKQLAVAYNGFTGGLTVALASVTDDLGFVRPMMSNQYPPANPSKHFSIAAGGFAGRQDSNNLRGSLSIAWWSPAIFGATTVNYNVALFKVTDGGISQAAIGKTKVPTPADPARLPVVAYDRDGDAMRLGAPLHITMQRAIRTDYILYEPPKHTYWDAKAKKVVTVSRYPEFNVELETQKGQEFANKSTDTTNWTVGGSASASSGATVKVGQDAEIAEVSAETCFQLTIKASYDYESSEATSSSQFNTREVGVQGATGADDYLQGRYQLIDLWRYRVYGVADTTTNSNVFYDIMIPGPYIEFQKMPGLAYDWFQPLHENGNILSYPRYLGADLSNRYQPTDVGSFSLPDGTVVNEPMIKASQQAWGGTSGRQFLRWTTQTEKGTEAEYQHKFNASVDFKYAQKATAESKLVGGISENTSVSVNAHGGASWGNATTTENTTNGSTEITLNTAKDPFGTPGNGSQSYSFFPVFYTAQDGTVKVVHAVDVLGSNIGRSFWKGLYAGRPDPALNLPARFQRPDEEWEPNPIWSQRKLIRGFNMTEVDADPSVTNPDPDPVVGDYDPLAYAPLAGDKVRLSARVYNYSLDTPVTNLKVRFEAVKYNDADMTESGERVLIGEDTISIGTVTAGTQMGVASIVWDTKDVGPAQAGTAQDYRIYVVLDPENAIPNEIYETEPEPEHWKPGSTDGNPLHKDWQPMEDEEPEGWDPGQNNEGFQVVTIKSPPLLNEPLHPSEMDVHMRDGALAAVGPSGNLETLLAQAKEGEPMMLRATVHTDTSHSAYSEALFYDGDPDAGGELIAGKRIFAGDPEGSHVWITWTPKRSGSHQLYVRVLEDTNDTDPGNHEATLRVVVLPKTPVPTMDQHVWLPFVQGSGAQQGAAQASVDAPPVGSTPAGGADSLVSAGVAAPAGRAHLDSGVNCGGGGGEGEEEERAAPLSDTPAPGHDGDTPLIGPAPGSKEDHTYRGR